MKKMTLLLILISLIWQPLCLSAQTNTEKFDLTPKIKKGDSWKMVFILNGNTNFETQGSHKTGELVADGSSYGQNNTFSEWQVECSESIDSVFILKFTLLRIKKNDQFKLYDGLTNYYFDTNYPANTSKEYMSAINKIIGKSFSYRLTWNQNIATDLIIDEFEHKSIALPSQSYTPKKGSFLYSFAYNSNVYKLIGLEFMELFFKAWHSSLPKGEVEVGESWKIGKQNNPISQNIKGQLIDKRNNLLHVKIGDGNIKSDYILNETNGLLVAMNSFPSRSYIYDFHNIHNTIVTGKISNTKDVKKVSFRCGSPGNYFVKTIEIKNGEFKFAANLKEPNLAHINFDTEGAHQLFLKPGSNIYLEFDNINKPPKVSGHGAEDVTCVLQFWNNAPPFLHFGANYKTSEYSTHKINIQTQQYRNIINDLLKDFSGKISKECQIFIETETNFRIGWNYIKVRENIEREKVNALKFSELKYQAKQNAEFVMNYLDSLPLHGNIAYDSPSHNDFLQKYLKLKHNIFLYNRGRNYNKKNLRENLLFAELQYSGYPYYVTAFELLKKEVLDGSYSQFQKEFDDFEALPCDKYFSNELKRLIKEMETIKIGNPFPFSEIKDFEGNTFTFSDDEFTIVDVMRSYYQYQLSTSSHKEEIIELTDIIKKEKRIKRINYMVLLPSRYKKDIVETVGTDSVRIQYIYLPDVQFDIIKKLKADSQNRIFLIDKNHKIIHSNIGRIRKYTPNNLQKAINDYVEAQNQPKSHEGRKAMLLGAFITLFGTTLIAWLIIKINSRQIKKREVARRKLSELELKAIRSQMNPHFIFNAMGSIQNLINQNNSRNANLYLSRFARLMRMVLSNSNKKLVSLSEEIELLRHYLELEQLRVDFQFAISLSENVDPETEEIPGMLIQPFVENAVIHGITPKGNGNISVEFSKTKDTLVCKIIDDGVGINTSSAGNGNGVAMKLSEKRLNLLNSQLQTKLRLSVENRMDSEQTEGTKITLLIPVG